MHVFLAASALGIGWLMVYIGCAIAGLFLIGLCAWLIAHHGHGLLHLHQRLEESKRRRLHELAARRELQIEQRRDESLMASEGVHVDLSRTGPDERGSSQRLARLRGRDDHRSG